MDTSIRKVKLRNSNASVAVELAVGSFFLLTMMLLAIDVTVMMIGFSMNDRACRDAARAAAQCSDANAAQAAARAALMAHKGDGYWITTPILLTGGSNFIYSDNGGNALIIDPPPSVTVTTQITCRYPVPINFFGAKFGDNGSGLRGTSDFRKRYLFPIVKYQFDPTKTVAP